MTRICLLILALILASTALAQEGHYHEGDVTDTQYDPLLTPLVLPTVDNFAPVPAADPKGTDAALAPVSVGAYFDVADEVKSFQIAPAYRFIPSLRAAVRIPWIIERKLEYYEHEATAGGLGDIAVDVEYTHQFGKPGQRLRLLASVKLPTGDEEKTDSDDYAVPLGTGSVDLVVRANYARSTEKSGLVAAALYRANGSSETTSEWVGPTYIETTTTTTTAGNQFVASLFGRRQVADRWWLHLGASLMLTGDGKVESETTYDDGSPDYSSEIDVAQASTLVDLFPGVSREFGTLTPYLGVRIPVMTSFSEDTVELDRGVAVTLQVTYRPEGLFAVD